jgi:hypothetical protein
MRLTNLDLIRNLRRRCVNRHVRVLDRHVMTSRELNVTIVVVEVEVEVIVVIVVTVVTAVIVLDLLIEGVVVIGKTVQRGRRAARVLLLGRPLPVAVGMMPTGMSWISGSGTILSLRLRTSRNR